MLGKLLKHELRATARLIPLMYLAAALLALIATVLTSLKLTGYDIAAGSLLMFAGFASLIVSYIVIIMRFYKGIYGNEGYFWMTLPVSQAKLYLSRLIVGFCWTVASSAVAAGGYAYAMYLFSRNTRIDFGIEFEKLVQILTPKVCAVLISIILIQQLYFLVQVNLCITLSNIRPFQSLGLGAAVIAYMIISFIDQIIQGILAMFVPLTVRYTEGVGWSFQNGTMWSSLKTLGYHHTRSLSTPPIGYAGYILYPVLIVVLAILTVKLMRDKVNLK